MRMLAVLLLSTSSLLAAEPLTPIDAVTVHSISSPDLSPDGRNVVYVVSSADLDESRYDSDLWMIRAGGEPFRFAATSHSETSPRWSPDGTMIAFLSNRSGTTQVWLIPPDGGEAFQLTSSDELVNGFLWSPSGDAIAFLSRDPVPEAEKKRTERKDDARVAGTTRPRHLHLIDVETRETKRLTSGDDSIFDFGFAPDGNSIVLAKAPAISLEGLFATDLYSLSLESGMITPLVEREGMDSAPEFSPDGRWIAFLTHQGKLHWNQQFRLAVVPASGGEPVVVSEQYARTPRSVHWTADSKSLVFEGALDTTAQIFRVDRDGHNFRQLTNVEGVVHELSFSPATGHAVLVRETLTTPPELHAWNFRKPEETLRRLTSHNREFLDRELGETKIVRWKNPEDGLEIEGLLTLPIGYEEGDRVPLITFVHGGPASHFDQRFVGYLGTIYPVHSYAARGFAVLRPNPRGTGSYAEPFRQANQADWGGMDYLDIQAGIDLLIEKGIADPERLGMMGWSYGGYMTAWTITQTDRFVAVGIGAPVVDLLSFHGTTDIPGFIPSYFDSTPWENPELHRERSPMWNIAHAKTPALIQHGTEDDRVPISQGQMLHRALEELGVPTVMVIYPRTPHTPREPLLRIDSANRNLWWFEKWLMGKDATYEEWLAANGDRKVYGE